MQIVIEIPNVPIQDYQDLYYKIHGMAASEGLFDDKIKSQRALALKAVLDVLNGIVNGTPLPKGHGDLIDRDMCLKMKSRDLVDADGVTMYAVPTGNILRMIPVIPADKEGAE